ncbi:MAG: ATP-dependent DNA helicase RecG [Lentimonas sp.]|jgi:ATP-dependent DNA helicase RecG
MNNFLMTPIEYLKGVGPQRSALLKKELGIHCYQDLLDHFPFRYVDRREYQTIRDAAYLDSALQLKGKIIQASIVGAGRGKRFKAIFEDNTGRIELVWFKGMQYIQKAIVPGRIYQVYGKAKRFGSSYSIPHPEVTAIENVDNTFGMQGVYSSTERLTEKGLHSKGISRLCVTLVELLNQTIPETLPQKLVNELNVISLEAAYRQIHAPQSEEHARKAIFRLKFEELFFLQLELIQRKQISYEKGRGFVFEKLADIFNDFYSKKLPFELTNAQKKVTKEIRIDLMTGRHMNRLIQGDVGSGKTLVALMSILMALDNGFQGALMAPTEILANQHFKTIEEQLDGLPVNVALLTGSTTKKQRVKLHEELQNGSIHILIGTHALLEDNVQFHNLGIVVIDEQHRFGVAQRARMWKKNKLPPHILIMTATPIPRTLAMTFYGDLDVSVIDELPPGRKPVTTSHKLEGQRLRVFDFIKKEIEKGRQVYVVYPLIEESETLDLNNLMSGFEAISRAFPRPEYQLSMLHGKMKAKDKEFEMNRFTKGETQIMVATTVIEVGVNVPNASVMIIENSERFGLSQLHQLRGRVGRGAEQSFCILMSSIKLSNEAKKRIETMVRTNDGFEVAEVDLEIRGPGDIMGTQQSGDLQLKIADLATDGQLVSLARDKAREVLSADTELAKKENALVYQKLNAILKAKPNWGKIS